MIAVDLIDASLLPAIAVALLAGVLSFLSPCVLPIVPPYLAYMSGISVTELSAQQDGRNRAILPAVFFVLGLSTVFLLLGFTASYLGMIFLSYQNWFNTIAGLTVMILGGHFVGIYRIAIFDRELRVDAGDRGGSAFGAYILGIGVCFWLDTLYRATTGGNSVTGCVRGINVSRIGFTGGLCRRARSAVFACCGVFARVSVAC